MEYDAVKKDLLVAPFLIDVAIDHVSNGVTLVDTGCKVYGVMHREQKTI